nr:MAG TPA: hypothetical protein [Caudoviricetes sp.]
MSVLLSLAAHKSRPCGPHPYMGKKVSDSRLRLLGIGIY